MDTTFSQVSLHEISYQYNDNQVLTKFTYSFESRNRTVILGPSGCGKSTILRIIAGLITPNEGRIEIDGVNITSLPPHKRNIGLMFQQYALWPHLSVKDHIGFGLKFNGSHKQEQSKRISEVISLLGLNGLEGRFPHELSGGQQQRVALGRAIAPSPKVLMLDEPFAHLEPSLRVELLQSLEAVHNTTKSTLIMVTHDTNEALAIAQKLLIIGKSGSIEGSGIPEMLYRTPPSLAVANALGEWNAIPGKILSNSESKRIFLTTFGSFNMNSLSTPTHINKEMTLLVSPEFISLQPIKTENFDETLILSGKVKRREFLGSFYKIIVEIEDSNFTIIIKLSSLENPPDIDHFVKMYIPLKACTLIHH